MVSVVPGDDIDLPVSLSSSDVIEDFVLQGVPQVLTEQSQFNAVFVSNHGKEANLTSLIEVLASHEATGEDIDVDEYFALTELGHIELIDPIGLDNALSNLPDGALSLHFIAQDSDLLNYTGEVDILHGEVPTQLKVMPPTDYPALDLNLLEIHATYLKSPYQTTFAVDEMGNTQSYQLPKGNWQFEASWTDEFGRTYSSSAQLSITSSTVLQLNLLSLEEIIDGKPEFTKLAVLASLRSESVPERQVEVQPKSMAISTMSTTGTSVVTGSKGVANKVSKRYPIMEGTQNIVLKYTVTSAEYPTYVKQQSVYNDVWQVDLRASNGTKLYSISREVNSQLYSQPLWQSNGQTKEITEVIDVSSLAQSSDEVVLTLSATNIGDSALDTSITANLTSNEIAIDSITLDTSLPDKRKSKLGKYFSIPASTSNVFHRYLTVNVSKPDDVTIDKISIDLVHGGSETSIVSGSIGSDGIEQLSETEYKVRATFANPSPYAVGSPVFDNFQYKVTVESDSAQADKSTDQLNALWKLPSSINRFGGRDTGGDGWSSVATYNWLDLNGGLITKVNDISGEHGRNIGHKTHKAGNDIDTLHFVEYHPNGTLNYKMMGQALATALNGDADGQAKVIDWVAAQRQGLDNLAANAKVKRLYSADGNPYEHASVKLPDHWFTTIMTTGAITVGTKSFDTQLGTWSNAKVRRNDVHNNHDHITLIH
ncbi:hypothetical protein [Vibrio vulnificus]|uniref:hypothetical protein n=1 Tax=Vibrio vulnificus TaxID=672 RepID=UPI001302B75A|nr:hypothetical protein [Vibrio vulnificus]